MRLCLPTRWLFSVLPIAGLLIAAAPDPRLQDLLRRFPEADANRDGVLTFDEAQAFGKTIKRGDKRNAGKSSTADHIEDTGAPRSSAKKPAPTHADVSYGPHERNILDLWLAKSSSPTPLVIYIHGGGFTGGSKAGASAVMINGCLDAGVSFMAINYRYRTSAPIQDILRDCARSIQFVRSKAGHYNLDPKRIAVYGGSAGAGTSLWLAFHDDLADAKNPDPVLRESSRVVAAGAINTQATYNLRRWSEVLGRGLEAYERPGETGAFYGARSEAELGSEKIKAAMHDADMLAHISKDDPPVFLFTAHPEGEIANRGHLLHHPAHARAVKRRCDELGVPATQWFALTDPILEGDYQDTLRDFLLRHVKQ
jgi:acetyl esterase/lipase